MMKQHPSEAPRPSTIPWPPILIVVLAALSIALQHVFPLPWPGLDDLPARLAGGALCATGLALIIWGIRTLRRHNTTVLPNQAASTLVTDGPFAYRRNPIYLGDLLLFIGVSILTTNLWFFAAGFCFVALVLVLAILPEERHLEKMFGQQWHEYADKTRRLF